MGFSLADIVGGGLGSLVKEVVGTFHLSPEKQAEFQSILDQNAAQLAMKQLELDTKVQDSVSREIEASSANIQAEAKSQSWIPRNVRPLLLLMWGTVITFNPVASIISQFMAHPVQPITLDPWIYKLTAIGFTGYATLRTFEKWKERD